MESVLYECIILRCQETVILLSMDLRPLLEAAELMQLRKRTIDDSIREFSLVQIEDFQGSGQ